MRTILASNKLLLFYNEQSLVMMPFSGDLGMKSAIQAVTRMMPIRKHLTEEDFIVRAITRYNEPFDVKKWPVDPASSLSQKFLDIEFGHCPPVLEKMIHFCRKKDHRKLNGLNDENLLKAVPRKETLKALKDKYPGG